MNFISIDIETTGLNEENCQIIEIGAVMDNWNTPMDDPPSFHTYVTHNVFQGEPYALSMHPKIFRRIADKEDGYSYNSTTFACVAFEYWLDSIEEYSDEGKWTVAGKNYAGFDARFLRKIGWDLHNRLRHRVLDPGSLFWNPLTDTRLPDTKECAKRAGVSDTVAHTALEDAEQVARLIQAYSKSCKNFIVQHSEMGNPLSVVLDAYMDGTPYPWEEE